MGATPVRLDQGPAASEHDEAGERGTLSVADRVVGRIAGYAVTLVDDAAAAPRRVLGVNMGSARPDDDANVSARVDGCTATVDVTIAVRWPASVRAVAEDARRHIRDEITRITDVRVDHIDVDVVSMDVPTRRPPRVR